MAKAHPQYSIAEAARGHKSGPIILNAKEIRMNQQPELGRI